MSLFYSFSQNENLPEKINIEDFKQLDLPNLKTTEKEQIISMFNAGFFRSTIGFIHKTASDIMKQKLNELCGLKFNKILVQEEKNAFSCEGILIFCSAELLGVLNRVELIGICKTIYLLQTINVEGDEREVKDKDVLEILNIYIKAIFSKDFINFGTKYKNFVDKLHFTEILTFSEDYVDIIEAPANDQLIILEELFFADDIEGNDALIKNIKNFLPILWEKLGLKQKIIISVLLKNNKHKSFFSETIKFVDILTDEKMFVKAIELSVNAFISHFDENYSNNELLILKTMQDDNMLTNQLTTFTLSRFLMAFLRGINKQVKGIALKFLIDVSEERWNYYFKNYFESDKNLMLSILSNKNGSKNWCEFVNIFGKENLLNKKLASASLQKDYKEVQDIFLSMYEK